MQIILDLNDREAKAMEDLCAEKGLTPVQVLRHSFRAYQSAFVRSKLTQEERDSLNACIGCGTNPCSCNPE